MSEIKAITGTEFDELLQQVHLDELDAVDLHINQRLDMSVVYAMGGVKNCVLFVDAPA